MSKNASEITQALADIRLSAKYLRAYGLKPETRAQVSKLLNHKPCGEQAALAALLNDPAQTPERRNNAGKTLALLGRVYRYCDPTDPAPAEFNPKGVADLLETLAGMLDEMTESEAGELPSNDNLASMAMLASLLDDDALKIASIAQDKSKSVELRLRLIAKLDRRYCDKKSPELAMILGCTPQAIRGTEWWTNDRKPDY